MLCSLSNCGQVGRRLAIFWFAVSGLLISQLAEVGLVAAILYAEGAINTLFFF